MESHPFMKNFVHEYAKGEVDNYEDIEIMEKVKKNFNVTVLARASHLACFNHSVKLLKCCESHKKQGVALQRGFTLVELSIVLVIIGLIVGGVMGGSALIHQAKISKLGRQGESYISAVLTFEAKYHQIPGDMRNATDYWPTTSNGNGNRNIDVNAETMRFWNHLALSGMIQGSYPTDFGVGEDLLVPGYHVPATPFDGNAMSAYKITYYGDDGNAIQFGKPNSSGSSQRYKTNGGSVGFSAVDGKNLDKKFDDGAANTGIITGNSSCTGIGYTDPVGGDYRLSREQCGIYWWLH